MHYDCQKKDEKIQNVLSHFKKDFEGDVSKEELAAKYGHYASFLHSYAPSPPRSSGWSHPKTQHRNCSTQKTTEECATNILKIMTSFPVPGGAIISPLHESFLCLKENERFSGDVKPVPFLKGDQTSSANLCLKRKERFSNDVKPLPLVKGGQTSSALFAKESVSLVGKLSKKRKVAANPSKVCSDAPGNKEDVPRGSLALSKHKVVQHSGFCVKDKFLMSSAKEKAEGKKLHSSKSSKRAVPHGSVEIGVNRESRDLTEATHGVSKSQDKMQKLRFQDSSKFRENLKIHTKIEKKDSQMPLFERPSGNKRKDSTIGGFGMVHNASFDNSKQGFSGKQVDKNSYIHLSRMLQI
ncbi:cysteine-tryptophan domain-containing zinc finger protein 7-like [Euphorbia lathyris]|uniref:cysteine-tryptophan domain-containing zinc finger protein 7-like n=1 Tax=Euphorbia lathyris TaxID=212925 RepID=UPI0033143ECD